MLLIKTSGGYVVVFRMKVSLGTTERRARTKLCTSQSPPESKQHSKQRHYQRSSVRLSKLALIP